MINEYEGEVIERLSQVAKNNGAIVSTKLASVQFDFGKTALQFHGDYKVDMLTRNKELNYIMQTMPTLSKDPYECKYKNSFFGLAGGRLEIQCAEWYQLEEVVTNFMEQFSSILRQS